MTSDKDKELVPKGRVKDKVWQLTVFHRDLGDVVSRETICDAINALEPACADVGSAKPEDVTVLLSKVHDAIDELGEMAVGRGVPNKISARKLLDMLDGLDKYPVPADVREKPEVKDEEKD